MKTVAIQELIQTALREKFGLPSRVGWNMDNGVLMQVTVFFDAADVRDKKVSELDNAAKAAVAGAFDTMPPLVNVQIACTGKSWPGSA